LEQISSKPQFNQSTFWVKLTNWEFWPFWIVYFFVMLYHCWLSLRAGSFFFFSTSNPGIELGGMLGESKSGILHKIPNDFRANFVLIKAGTGYIDALDLMNKSGLIFPIIAKPDVGERGQGVKKINSLEELIYYHFNTRADYIIQEFVDFEIELGVFYYRYPDTDLGTVSSVVMKDFLKVVGDGRSTLVQLIVDYPRARFVKESLFKAFKSQLENVLPNGKQFLLEGIGNHCRGTTFLNANDIITEKMVDVFDKISKQIDGFYYGRYDLRCKSIEDLYEGKNIKIVELNGCGAEPAHIYHPGFSFWKGQKVLLQHHKTMFEISLQNHKKGLPFASWAEIMESNRAYKEAIQNISISES
jgi:hypothetical protein